MQSILINCQTRSLLWWEKLLQVRRHRLHLDHLRRCGFPQCLSWRGDRYGWRLLCFGRCLLFFSFGYPSDFGWTPAEFLALFNEVFQLSEVSFLYFLFNTLNQELVEGLLVLLVAFCFSFLRYLGVLSARLVEKMKIRIRVFFVTDVGLKLLICQH